MIKERIIQLLEYKGIPKEDFYVKIGMTSASFRGNAKKTPLNSNAIENILSEIDDANPEWIITGKGTMLRCASDIKIFVPEDLPKTVGKLYLAPIYEAYPVSAGKMGMAEIRDEKPNGYVYTTIQGAKFFPVIGFSFEPIIPAGSYIGTVPLNSWDRVDTEKIYFIVTREERMMKRLRIDDERKDILWCVSPNFPEFKILKNDILEIEHVFFYGKMV